MSKSKTLTVNLTSRTMSAVRTGESLSGRMNRIVDRYLALVECDEPEYHRKFYSDEQWSMLLAVAESLTPAADIRQAFLNAVGRNDKGLEDRLRILPKVSIIVLIEMLEAELLAENAGNHKR